MADHPIPHVEIPRPPVPQPPERLFLFVCNDENPQGRSHSRSDLAYSQLGGAYQQQAYAQQAWLQGCRPDKGIHPETLILRRAEPEDLVVFGFRATPVSVHPEADRGEVMRALTDLMDRLTSGERTTMLALLQEKYG